MLIVGGGGFFAGSRPVEPLARCPVLRVAAPRRAGKNRDSVAIASSIGARLASSVLSPTPSMSPRSGLLFITTIPSPLAMADMLLERSE